MGLYAIFMDTGNDASYILGNDIGEFWFETYLDVLSFIRERNIRVTSEMAILRVAEGKHVTEIYHPEEIQETLSLEDFDFKENPRVFLRENKEGV